jgi:hypothetical protein
MANLAEVLKELQQERSRLDEAIRVIGQLVSGNHTGAKGTKRTLSPAARERIAGRAEGQMGEGEGSEGVPAGAHHEQGRAESDRRSTACAVGQGEGSAEEGGLRSSVENERLGYNSGLCSFKARNHGLPAPSSNPNHSSANDREDNVYRRKSMDDNSSS